MEKISSDQPQPTGESSPREDISDDVDTSLNHDDHKKSSEASDHSDENNHHSKHHSLQDDSPVGGTNNTTSTTGHHQHDPHVHDDHANHHDNETNNHHHHQQDPESTGHSHDHGSHHHSTTGSHLSSLWDANHPSNSHGNTPLGYLTRQLSPNTLQEMVLQAQESHEEHASAETSPNDIISNNLVQRQESEQHLHSDHVKHDSAIPHKADTEHSPDTETTGDHHHQQHHGLHHHSSTTSSSHDNNHHGHQHLPQPAHSSHHSSSWHHSSHSSPTLSLFAEQASGSSMGYIPRNSTLQGLIAQEASSHGHHYHSSGHHHHHHHSSELSRAVAAATGQSPSFSTLGYVATTTSSSSSSTTATTVPTTNYVRAEAGTWTYDGHHAFPTVPFATGSPGSASTAGIIAQNGPHYIRTDGWHYDANSYPQPEKDRNGNPINLAIAVHHLGEFSLQLISSDFNRFLNFRTRVHGSSRMCKLRCDSDSSLETRRYWTLSLQCLWSLLQNEWHEQTSCQTS